MNYFFINSDAGARRDVSTCNLLIEHGFACSGGDYKKYGMPLKKFAPYDICLLYHDKKGIVAVGRILEEWDGRSHTQNKIIYLSDYPEYRLRVDWFLDLRKTPIDPLVKFGYTPRGVVQRVVKSLDNIKEFIANLSLQQLNIFSDEAKSIKMLTEGEESNINSTVRKRNQFARDKCLEHWGQRCFICKFDFQEKYGPLGATGIHVHHLHPISNASEARPVDPINDLRPVCPNCHAMIHKKNPPYTPEEITEFIKQNRTKCN